MTKPELTTRWFIRGWNDAAAEADGDQPIYSFITGLCDLEPEPWMSEFLDAMGCHYGMA